MNIWWHSSENNQGMTKLFCPRCVVNSSKGPCMTKCKGATIFTELSIWGHSHSNQPKGSICLHRFFLSLKWIFTSASNFLVLYASEIFELNHLFCLNFILGRESIEVWQCSVDFQFMTLLDKFREKIVSPKAPGRNGQLWTWLKFWDCISSWSVSRW